jgi:hypothetical protein
MAIKQKCVVLGHEAASRRQGQRGTTGQRPGGSNISWAVPFEKDPKVCYLAKE